MPPVDAQRAARVGAVGHHIPRVELRPAEGILRKPQVAGENVGVLQIIRRAAERVEVVFRGVVGRDEELHAEVLRQILELLFEIADHDMDLLHARLVQLADQPLNEHLPVDAQERLGRLRVDRHHVHPRPGGEDDGAPRRRALRQLQRAGGGPPLL